MGSALLDIVTLLRRDAIRTIAVCCLVLMALAGSSISTGVGALLVAIIVCVDAIQTDRAAKALGRIATGDRFVAFPANWIDSRACRNIASAGERMRRDLIDADAAMADQRRLLAEVRIRREGAAFFTDRFHGTVAQAFTSFAARGDEICATVEDLNKYNSGLLRDAHTVSGAVAGTATDIQAVSQAAAQIGALVATTSDQIAASENATRATLVDLRRARDTIERLKHASHEISTIVATIRSVATQTSLLALNATIEAARAGESGQGFAVVAGEVKVLATRSEKATGTIRRQIEAIQGAVDETSVAIEAIMTRVSSMTATHEAFTASLAQSTAAIETVGAKADHVAGHVSQAMPDLASGVGEIEMAGRSVLDNARKLMAGSERLVASFQTYFQNLASGSIRVGILHSLSGTLTAAERPLHDLLIGLIDETNANGGLLGRPLEAVIANPRAEAKAYADGAKTLLDRGAAVIFGGWTSQSRHEMRPVVEAADGLLFYPSQYEGGEASPSIVYTGGTPQQQAWPAVDFLVGRGRRRLVLIGHASIYSRGTHASIKRYAGSVGADIVFDLDAPAGDADWTRLVTTILKMEHGGALAVVSTLTGDASVRFFRELARRRIGAARLPVLSLTIGEAEMPALETRDIAGHCVAWNYLHGVRAPENDAFIATWRRISGDPHAVTNDALQATWLGFAFWTMAVKKAGSVHPHEVRAALRHLSLDAPNGFRVALTSDRHLSLPAFVGEVGADRTIVPVWASRAMRDPDGREVPLDVRTMVA